MKVILKGASQVELSLLKIDRHPKTALNMSLCTRNPTPYSCCPILHLNKLYWCRRAQVWCSNTFHCGSQFFRFSPLTTASLNSLLQLRLFLPLIFLIFVNISGINVTFWCFFLLFWYLSCVV